MASNELMDAIRGQSDRISKMLNKQTSGYKFGDLNSALISGKPISQISQGRRAQEIQQQSDFWKGLMQEKGVELNEGRLNLSQKEYRLRESTFKAERGDKTHAGINEGLNRLDPTIRAEVLAKAGEVLNDDDGTEKARKTVLDIARQLGHTPKTIDEMTESEAFSRAAGQHRAKKRYKTTLSDMTKEADAKRAPKPEIWVSQDGKEFMVDENDRAAVSKASEAGAVSKEKTSAYADRPQYRSVVFDKTGRRIGREMIRNGVRTVMGANGKLLPWSDGYVSRTGSEISKSQMTGNVWKKYNSEMGERRQGIKKLERYWETRKDSAQGWRVVTDKITNAFTTFFGGRIPTQRRFNLAKSRGQLRGLMGSIKKEVLGGGVLSNQDVALLLERLGGDITSLNNKGTVGAAIKEIMQDKIELYNNELPNWNFQVSSSNRGMKPLDPIKIDMKKMFGDLEPIERGAETKVPNKKKTIKQNGRLFEFIGGKWTDVGPSK
jgi:hypothetical protein